MAVPPGRMISEIRNDRQYIDDALVDAVVLQVAGRAGFVVPSLVLFVEIVFFDIETSETCWQRDVHAIRSVRPDILADGTLKYQKETVLLSVHWPIDISSDEAIVCSLDL